MRIPASYYKIPRAYSQVVVEATFGCCMPGFNAQREQLDSDDEPEQELEYFNTLAGSNS